MAVKYTLNGIEYNDVKTRGKEYQPIPPLVSDTIYNCNTEDLQESFNGGSIPTIVNAIEIDWNDAYLQRNNKSLNNTSDLLNILDNTVPAELFDEYTERVEDAYNSSYNYIQKTSTLEHTIDNLKSTITYIESDVSGVKQSMGSIIEQTASGISTRVESLESQYNGLSGRISANTSSIEQTANRITSKVESLETQYDGLSGRVSANTSSIEQTADRITSEVNSLQTQISGTNTTIDNIKTSITESVSGISLQYSTLHQTLTNDYYTISGVDNKLSLTEQGLESKVSELISFNMSGVSMYDVQNNSNIWIVPCEYDYNINQTSTFSTNITITKNGYPYPAHGVDIYAISNDTSTEIASFPIATENIGNTKYRYRNKTYGHGDTNDSINNTPLYNRFFTSVLTGSNYGINTENYNPTYFDVHVLPLYDNTDNMITVTGPRSTTGINDNGIYSLAHKITGPLDSNELTEVYSTPYWAIGITGPLNQFPGWDSSDSNNKTLRFKFNIFDENNQEQSVYYDLNLVKIPKGQNGSASQVSLDLYKLTPVLEKYYIDTDGKIGLSLAYTITHELTDNNGKVTILNKQELPANYSIRVCINPSDTDDTNPYKKQFTLYEHSSINNLYTFEEKPIFGDGDDGKQSNYEALIEDDDFNMDIDNMTVCLYEGNNIIDQRIVKLSFLNTSIIDQKREAITLAVQGSLSGMNNIKSEIEVDLSGIRSNVKDLSGNYSTINQSLNEISTKVVGLSGSVSEIKTTTDNISAQVTQLSGIVASATGMTFNNSNYELAVVNEEAYVNASGNLIANFNYTLAKHVKTESENNIINNYDFIENEEAYRNNDKTNVNNSLFYVSIYDNIGLLRNNDVFCEVDPKVASDDKKNELIARGFKLYEKYGNINIQTNKWENAMFSTIAPVSGSGNDGLNRRDYYPINSLTNFWESISGCQNITSYWDLPKDKRPESFTIEFREDVKQPNGVYSNKLISRRIIKIGLQTSATLDITDDRIRSSVGVSGIIGSTIEQSLSGIKHEVYDANGNLNKTMQTVQSTVNWIGDANGNYSSFTQAVSGIASEVAGASGISSLIAQTATGIHASVVSGLSRTGIDIEHENINVSSDNFKIIDNNGDVNMYINNRGDLYISGNISNDDNNIYTESDWKNTFIPVKNLLFVHNDITPTGSINDGYPIQHNFLIDTDGGKYDILDADINKRIDIGSYFAQPGEENAYMLDLSQTTNNINIYNSGISGSSKLIYFPYINPLGDNGDHSIEINNISFSGTSVAWRLAPIGHDYCGNILFETPDNEVCYGSYSIIEGFEHNSSRAETVDFARDILPNNYSLYFNIKASYNDGDGDIYSGSDLVITNKTGKNISLSEMKLCYQFESISGIKGDPGYVQDNIQDIIDSGIIKLNNANQYLLNLFIEVKVNNNDNDKLMSNTITFAVYKQDDPLFIRTLTKFGNQPLHYYTYNEFNKTVGNRFIITNHSRDKLFIVYNYENSTKLDEGDNHTKYGNITPGRFVRLVEKSTGKLDPDIHNSDYVIIWPNSSLGFTVTKEENTYYSTSISGIDAYSLTGIADYEKYAPVLWIKPDYISYNINEAKDCLFNSNTFGKQVYFTN